MIDKFYDRVSPQNEIGDLSLQVSDQTLRKALLLSVTRGTRPKDVAKFLRFELERERAEFEAARKKLIESLSSAVKKVTDDLKPNQQGGVAVAEKPAHPENPPQVTDPITEEEVNRFTKWLDDQPDGEGPK